MDSQLVFPYPVDSPAFVAQLLAFDFTKPQSIKSAQPPPNDRDNFVSLSYALQCRSILQEESCERLIIKELRTVLKISATTKSGQTRKSDFFGPSRDQSSKQIFRPRKTDVREAQKGLESSNFVGGVCFISFGGLTAGKNRKRDEKQGKKGVKKLHKSRNFRFSEFCRSRKHKKS